MALAVGPNIEYVKVKSREKFFWIAASRVDTYFKEDFEILSILRNLKIIGIFTRLAFRDDKKKYIKLIPHAWEMIDYRLKQNKIFKDLKLLLKNNFPEFVD